MQTRTRAEIEAAIRSKRAERELYTSERGVSGIHAQLDALLTEWEASGDVPARPAV